MYLTNVTGTGVTGTIRPDYTGAPVNAAPAGLFLNPAALHRACAGTVGRCGPGLDHRARAVSLNASIGRTFRLGSRLNARLANGRNQRAEHCDVSQSWNTIVTSPLFGLPNQANTMRKLQTTFRVRF